MLRNLVSAPLLALLLGMALALQGVIGCDVAHAEPVSATAGHCEEMAVPSAQHGQSVGAHDCATLCHPAVAQSAMPQPAQVAIHAPAPVALPLDDLSGGSIRPATPPPRMV